MPPSTKRRTRRRDVSLHEAPDTDALDSSPTRRSVKKRKVEHVPEPELDREGTLEPDSGAENGDSAPENDAPTNQELIDSVISTLNVAKEPIGVLAEHSNEKTREENKESVKAYAKIAGREWTYYVKSSQVNIGRPPDREQRADMQSSPVATAAQALPDVDIDLGPSKFISRFHAEISYDGNKDPPCWRIRVNGRNGVRLNNAFLRRGHDSQIRCGDIIEIANTQMMFVTPGDDAVIHPSFKNKAHPMVAAEENGAWDASHHAHPESAASTARPMPTASQARAHVNGQNGVERPPPIATPSKRQTTPARPRSRDTTDTVKPSPLYNRGMMMESTEEIDYSTDSAKDLKPPYSYANMIAQAIFSTEEEKMSLSNIYKFIMEKYAFYRHSSSGRQNSIRHNLSLNKAFQKVPRRTDEPGKGMKWMIAAEHRDEYWKKQGRKGPQSSAPSSPVGKEHPQRTNGQSSFERKPDLSQTSTKPSPQTASPYHSFSVAPVEAYTPDRGSRTGRGINGINHANYDQPSPLPTRPAQNTTTANETTRAYGLSDNVAGSPPVLSSSYYDDAASSMITPAPLRQQPRLAPPSTAQIPSKYMPMSSPAQFWKLADIGSTPGRPLPDMSPLKPHVGGVGGAGGGAGGAGNESGSRWDGMSAIPSSSPPPPNLGSPSKPGGGTRPAGGRRIDRVGGGGVLVEQPPLSRQQQQQPRWEDVDDNDDDDDDDAETGEFDLARGFQPIGSYHRQMSNAARASASASTT